MSIFKPYIRVTYGLAKYLYYSSLHVCSHAVFSKCTIMVKNLFGFLFRYCISSFKLFTSHVDKYWPSQHFSAPFKARKSRQAQACYIPQNLNTNKLYCYYWFIPFQISVRRNESSHSFDSQSIKVKTLVTLDAPFLLMQLKLWHFAATLWYNIIITPFYLTTVLSYTCKMFLKLAFVGRSVYLFPGNL